MKYYEITFTLKELKGYYFKFKQQPPTKIFALTTIFGQAMDNITKDSTDIIEKVSNSVLENTLFSKDVNGDYKPIKYAGTDNLQIPELEERPLLIALFVGKFSQEVIEPTQKHQ